MEHEPDDSHDKCQDHEPFGRPMGSIPMGTLAVVAGHARAREVYARLGKTRNNQTGEVVRVLGALGASKVRIY